VAEGTTFEIDIQADGTRAASAADSVKLLADRLDAASAASLSAADAVKASEAAYSQAESAADRAAKSVEKIGIAIQLQQQKMADAAAAGNEKAFEKAAAAVELLQQKQAVASEKADELRAALIGHAEAVNEAKSAAVAAQAAETQLGSAMASVKNQAALVAKALDSEAKAQKAASDAAAKTAKSQAYAAAKASAGAAAAAAGSGKVNEIAEGLGKLGGPLGIAGQKALGAAEGMKKLGASLGSAGPYVAMVVVVAALAAGLAVLGVAAAGAAIKISAWAVANADAARTQELVLAGIARSARGGDELAAAIDDISRSTGLADDKIQGMAKTLADSGLRGKELTDKLTETAEAAAKLEFGPDFQKRLLSMDVQTARFKKNIASTFSIGSSSLEPLLKGIRSLIELFDTQNASGRAMQAVFRSVFEPLIEGATKTIPTLRTNFILAQIQILKGLIQLKLFTQQYGDELRFAGKAVAVLTALIVGGLLLAIGFVIVNLIIIGAAFGFVVGVVTALIAGVVWLGAQLLTLGVAANEAVVGKIKAAFDWLASVSLSDIGTAMIDGLVNGITASAAKVTSALKGVVDGAVKTAKSALGIASPSKVFAEIGGYTAEGMSEGVSEGTADVQSTISDMVAPPEAAAPAAAAPAAKAEGGGGVTIIINGVEGAQGILDELQKLAIQLGAAVPA
jgi:hypothetical protein